MDKLAVVVIIGGGGGFLAAGGLYEKIVWEAVGRSRSYNKTFIS